MQSIFELFSNRSPLRQMCSRKLPLLKWCLSTHSDMLQGRDCAWFWDRSYQLGTHLPTFKTGHQNWKANIPIAFFFRGFSILLYPSLSLNCEMKPSVDKFKRCCSTLISPCLPHCGKISLLNKHWHFPKWLEEKCAQMHYHVIVLTVDTHLRTPVDKIMRNDY